MDAQPNVGETSKTDKTRNKGKTDKTRVKEKKGDHSWSCMPLGGREKRASESESVNPRSLRSTKTVMSDFHGDNKVTSPSAIGSSAIEGGGREFPFPLQPSSDKPEVSEEEKTKKEVLDRIKSKTAKKSDFAKLAEIINNHCKNSISSIIRNNGILKVEDLIELYKEISGMLGDISFARLKEIYEKIPDAKNPTVESLLSAEDNPSSNFNIELISNRLKKENLQNSKKIIREKFGVRSFKTIINMIEKMKLGEDEKIKKEYEKYVNEMRNSGIVDEGIEKSALRIFLEKHLLDLYRAEKVMENNENLDEIKENNSSTIRYLEEQEQKRRSTLDEYLKASSEYSEEDSDSVKEAEEEVRRRKDTLCEEMEGLQQGLKKKRQSTSNEGIEELEEPSGETDIKRKKTLDELFQGLQSMVGGIGDIAQTGVDIVNLAEAMRSGDIGKIGTAITNITTSKDVTNLGDGWQELVNGISQILDGLEESDHLKALKEKILGKISVFKKSREEMQRSIEASMNTKDEVKKELKRAVEFDDRIEKVRSVVDTHQGKESSLQTETRQTESLAIRDFELLHYVNALADVMLYDMYKDGKLKYSKEELANNWIGLRDILYYSAAKEIPANIEIKGLTTYDPIVLDSAKIALEELYEKRLRNRAASNTLLRGALMISIKVKARQFKEWATRKVKPLDAEMVLMITIGAQRQAMKALQKKYGKKEHMQGFSSDANLSAESLSSIVHDFDTQNVSSDVVMTLVQAHRYQFNILEIAKAVKTYKEVDDMVKKVIRSSERLRNERMRHESIRALIGKTFLNIIQDNINNVDNMTKDTIESVLYANSCEMDINENIHILYDFDKQMILESENSTEKVKDAEDKTRSSKEEKSAHVKKYFNDVLARSTMSNLDRAVKVASTGLSLAIKFSTFA